MTQPAKPAYRRLRLNNGMFTRVNVSKYKFLRQWRWGVQWNPELESYYVIRSYISYANGVRKKVRVYMHREVMGNPKGKFVDHRDHNTLNNVKSNLRICTPAENAHNRRLSRINKSGFKGVHWDRGKWVASIDVGDGQKKKKHLGRFSDPKEASSVYRKIAIPLRKEFYCEEKRKGQGQK